MIDERAARRRRPATQAGRLLVGLALSALALGTIGCSDSVRSPTDPSPPRTADPPPSSVSQWSVTQSFVSVEGPDNCWVREQRERWTGAIFPDIPMTVTREGGSLTLESDYFATNYAGAVSGNQFSATGGPLDGGGRPCQDGSSFSQLPGVSNLSGSFGADERQLTAREVNSYRLTSGEPVTYTWGWQATRR